MSRVSIFRLFFGVVAVLMAFSMLRWLLNEGEPLTLSQFLTHLADLDTDFNSTVWRISQIKLHFSFETVESWDVLGYIKTFFVGVADLLIFPVDLATDLLSFLWSLVYFLAGLMGGFPYAPAQ